MKYNYITNVRDDENLRTSFNELTRKVYGFDFIDWYELGHWSDNYIPHVLTDHGKVISNISVNLMTFDVSGIIKNYIQLGTVMTDPDYRGQGLNRFIMERILDEYKGKVDGIYLFGNDRVLEYYPKFGFRPINEYEYSRKLNEEMKVTTDLETTSNIEIASNITGTANEGITAKSKTNGYRIEKVDMYDKSVAEKLYQAIDEYDTTNRGHNPNDAFHMCDNLGLYQFWLAAEFGESIYYIPEVEAYVIADLKSGILNVHQMISNNVVDMERLATSFDEVVEVKVGFTPINKSGYKKELHKEEDCTLFILGESLEQVERDGMMFPVMSHA